MDKDTKTGLILIAPPTLIACLVLLFGGPGGSSDFALALHNALQLAVTIGLGALIIAILRVFIDSIMHKNNKE